MTRQTAFGWHARTSLQNACVVIAQRAHRGLILQDYCGATLAYVPNGGNVPFSIGHLQFNGNHLRFGHDGIEVYRSRLRHSVFYEVVPQRTGGVTILKPPRLTLHRLGALLLELDPASGCNIQMTSTRPLVHLNRVWHDDVLLSQDVVATDQPSFTHYWEYGRQNVEKRVDSLCLTGNDFANASFVALGRWTREDGLKWFKISAHHDVLNIESVVRPLLASAMCQVTHSLSP